MYVASLRKVSREYKMTGLQEVGTQVVAAFWFICVVMIIDFQETNNINIDCCQDKSHFCFT